MHPSPTQVTPRIRATVIGVNKDAAHHFSKKPQDQITLIAGLGVEGDAHCGTTVQHRYDKKKDPARLNRRQVHLLQSELFDELSARGFTLRPGDLGENISTAGIDLLALSKGTQLRIGDDAVIEVTGLREPCILIERFHEGLLVHMGDRRSKTYASKAGIMGIVLHGGIVRPGDAIAGTSPSEHVPLTPV